MSETKKGLLPWPSDPEAFIAEARKNGKVQHWNLELQKFVREGSKGTGDKHEPTFTDPETSDLIFFGLPHCDPRGFPQAVMGPDNKKTTVFHPVEMIEGVAVKHLWADFETGCGVYLRLDAYDPNVMEQAELSADGSDEGGVKTKVKLGVKK